MLSGNLKCSGLQLLMQITIKTVPWMSTGQKMQNIGGFYRKVHNFLMVVILSKTYHISYKLVSNEYLKVKKFLPQIRVRYPIFYNKGEINLLFWLVIQK